MKSAKYGVAKGSGTKKGGHTVRIIANPVVSCRPEGDGGLLFNPDTDTVLLINSTGLVVWSYLTKPRSLEEIALHLMTMFCDTRDKPAVTRDVEAFFTDLTPDFIAQDGADEKEPKTR